jgi:hypothetical protein
MEEQSAEPVVLKQEEETHYVFDPKGHVKKDLDVIVGIGEERSIQITASAKIDDTEIPDTYMCRLESRPDQGSQDCRFRIRGMDGPVFSRGKCCSPIRPSFLNTPSSC